MKQNGMRLLFAFLLIIPITFVKGQIPLLEWVKSLESNFEKSVVDADLDAQNNIYLKGFFKSRLDFDPGPDSFNLLTQGIGDGFVSSLDSNGNFKWAKQLPAENENDASAIVVHNSIAYSTGIDFGLKTLQTQYSLVGNDTVLHYVNSGNNIEVDSAGDIIVLGDFNKPLDFDPSTDTLMLSPLGKIRCFCYKIIFYRRIKVG
jgi:hypothetical protein